MTAYRVDRFFTFVDLIKNQFIVNKCITFHLKELVQLGVHRLILYEYTHINSGNQLTHRLISSGLPGRGVSPRGSGVHHGDQRGRGLRPAEADAGAAHVPLNEGDTIA